MHSLAFTPISLFLLLLSPSSVLAKPKPSTDETCYTAYGPKPASTSPIPTSTKTIHTVVSKTIIRNTHPHTTVTPTTHVTSTEIDTETDTENATTHTDTATDTETTTSTTTTTLDTVTDVVTVTQTDTSTSTYPGTSTVAAPAGFTGAMDSLPNSVAQKRSLNGGSLAARGIGSRPVVGLAAMSKAKYAQSVLCIDIVYKTTTIQSIRPHPGTVTKTAKTATISSTETSTTTTTTTIYPADATTTTTTTVEDVETATESPTTVVTQTSTTTETVVTATASTYAACGPQSNNYIKGANGHGFNAAQGLGGSTYYGGQADSAAACCNKCFAIGNTCAQSSYSPLYGTGNECQLNIVPSPQTGNMCAYTNSGWSVSDGLALSNGPQNEFTFLCPGST